jgi:dodecin
MFSKTNRRLLESECRNVSCICTPAFYRSGRAGGPAVQSTVKDQRRIPVTQKIIEIVGTSKESFAKAAENSIAEAAKTVRGMKWARVAELEMELDGKKITKYRTTTKIYFDIEK